MHSMRIVGQRSDRGFIIVLTMMSSSSVGTFRVSVIGDNEDDELIVTSSVGARFRCACAGARSASGAGMFT